MSAANIIKFSLMVLLLHSCTVDTSSVRLKRSPDNKVVDFKGSKGKKRRPTENMEYIRKAKNNIMHNNEYDEEDEDDNDRYSLSHSYKDMYKRMAEEERIKRQKRPVKSRKIANKEIKKPNIFTPYSKPIKSQPLAENRTSKVEHRDHTKSQEDLYRELRELRKKLESLAPAKCIAPKVSPETKYLKRNRNADTEAGGSCILNLDDQ